MFISRENSTGFFMEYTDGWIARTPKYGILRTSTDEKKVIRMDKQTRTYWYQSYM